MKYQTHITDNSSSTIHYSRWQDFSLLVKFRLSVFVVLTALVGYMMNWKGSIDLGAVLRLLAGGFLVTWASNAMNEILEAPYDKLMKRTMIRPVADGRMSPASALLLCGIMLFTGIILLATFNLLTAFLGSLSFVLYAFVYTPLKRYTHYSVTVGAIPGALPAIIGGVAASGNITTSTVLLFAILFFWQFPHFWGIAWVGHEDYSQAGFRMLPNAQNERNSGVGMQSMYYALCIIPFLIWAVISGILIGWIAILIGICTIIYARYGYVLSRELSGAAAKKLMICSFFYLPFVFILLIIGIIK